MPADTVVEIRVKNCSESFCLSLKGKGLKVTFSQHNFKGNVQEHHFVYFYEVIINCYPNFILLYSSDCRVMDLFKSKESFKEEVNSDNN